MGENGLTVADALALRNGGNGNGNGNDNGLLGGSAGALWIVVILVLLLAGGRWGGYGGGNNGSGGGGTNTVVIPSSFGGLGGGDYNACCTPATQQGITDAFNFNQLDNGQRGLERGLCDGFYSVNLGITNLGTQMQQGFCSSDRANLQSFYSLNNTVNQGFNGIQSAIAQTNYNMKDCCCETRESIMQSNFNNQASFNAIQNQLASCCCELGRGQENIKYALAQQTCDIMANADRNTDRIINHLVQTEMDSLRTQLQSAQAQLSQNAQTRALIEQLQPCPKPAYPVMSPYQSIPISAFGCGCNSCC